MVMVGQNPGDDCHPVTADYTAELSFEGQIFMVKLMYFDAVGMLVFKYLFINLCQFSS